MPNNRDYRSPPAQPPSTAASLTSPSSTNSPPLPSPTHHHPRHSHSDSLSSSFSHDDLEEGSSIAPSNASTTTTTGEEDQVDNDSLADASPEEVADRANYLLSDDYKLLTCPNVHAVPGHPSSGSGSGGGGGGGLGGEDEYDNKPIPPIDPFTLPRKLPSPTTHPELDQSLRTTAEKFLKRCVETVDETDWMFVTPRVFGSPTVLGLAKRRSGRNGDHDEMPIEGEEERKWQDDAFNLRSYPLDPEGTLGISDLSIQDGGGYLYMEEGYQVGEGEYDTTTTTTTMEQSGIGFMDLAPGNRSNYFGTPYSRGEDEANAAGFGFGEPGPPPSHNGGSSSKRGRGRKSSGIVEGVEEMVMH